VLHSAIPVKWFTRRLYKARNFCERQTSKSLQNWFAWWK
jgi:hypothetical protein